MKFSENVIIKVLIICKIQFWKCLLAPGSVKKSYNSGLSVCPPGPLYIVFSGLVHLFFPFCMKLGSNKHMKVTEPIFWGEFILCPKWGHIVVFLVPKWGYSVVFLVPTIKIFKVFIVFLSEFPEMVPEDKHQKVGKSDDMDL